MHNEETILLSSHEAKMRPLQTELKTEKEKAEKLSLRLEAAQTENKKLSDGKRTADARVLELESENQALKSGADRDAIRVKHLEEANKALEATVADERAKTAKAENAKLADDINAVIKDALGAKIAPAIFDGYKDDPVAWMQARYVDFDAFKKQVDVLRGVPVTALSSTPVSSGHDPAKGEEPEEVEATEVDEKVAQMLEAGGVKVVADFSKAQNAADAKAIFEAAKKEQDNK